MHRTALVTLNMRELDRLKVIQAVVDLGLKPGHAAERLGLTVRQIERLVIRYRESGAVAPDLAQAWRSWQPAAGCGVGPAGPDDHPGSLRRFRADTGVREAPGMPRHPARQGNGTAADDGSWFVGATPATTAEGLSATSTAGVLG